MIEIKPVNINETAAIGVKIGNPEFPEKPAISVLLANKGLIACRNFDINALDKRRVAAARVTGARYGWTKRHLVPNDFSR